MGLPICGKLCWTARSIRCRRDGKVITYASGGASSTTTSQPSEKIMREAAPSEYRWSALILGIVKSQLFSTVYRAFGPERGSGSIEGDRFKGDKAMIITKKAIPRRTVLRGLRRAWRCRFSTRWFLRLPRRPRRQPIPCAAWGRSTLGMVRHRVIGHRFPMGARPSNYIANSNAAGALQRPGCGRVGARQCAWTTRCWENRVQRTGAAPERSSRPRTRNRRRAPTSWPVNHSTKWPPAQLAGRHNFLRSNCSSKWWVMLERVMSAIAAPMKARSAGVHQPARFRWRTTPAPSSNACLERPGAQIRLFGLSGCTTTPVCSIP